MEELLHRMRISGQKLSPIGRVRRRVQNGVITRPRDRLPPNINAACQASGEGVVAKYAGLFGE